MLKPRKIKIELNTDEIQIIIDELERVSHSVYKFMNYQKLVNKLKEELRK